MKAHEIISQHKDLFTALIKKGVNLNTASEKCSVYEEYKKQKTTTDKTDKIIIKDIARQYNCEPRTIKNYIKSMTVEVDYTPKELLPYKESELVKAMRDLLN